MRALSLRSTSIVALLPLLAACASSGGQSSRGLNWTPGEYVLEGTVSYDSGGFTQHDLYSADLLITPEGELSLTSSAGPCEDARPGRPMGDLARGERTFRCGFVRFSLRPGARTVRGSVNAPAVWDTIVSECVAYSRNANGVRVCVERRERVVTRSGRKGGQVTALRAREPS